MSNTQEAAHTQGPWEACGQYVRTARAADGSGGFLVAELPVNEPGMAERSRLIAAAPDLLEALLQLKRDGNDFAEWHPKFSPAIDAIYAAIAKATGAAA